MKAEAQLKAGEQIEHGSMRLSGKRRGFSEMEDRDEQRGNSPIFNHVEREDFTELAGGIC